MAASTLPGGMSEESAAGSDDAADDATAGTGDAAESSPVNDDESTNWEAPFGFSIVAGVGLGVVAGLVAGNMGIWVGVGAGVGAGLDLASRFGLLGLQPDETDEE